MAISTEKLLTLQQFQTGLAAAKNYTDTQVGTVNTKVSTLDGKVKALEEGAYDDTEVRGLISANTSAITKLNGSEEGSVAKKVNDAINQFATNVTDDGVVNSYKELIDYVAAHGPEAATMAGNIAANTTSIDALKNKVGETTVAQQIEAATADFLTADDITINVATDAEVTAACNAVFGAVA